MAEWTPFRIWTGTVVVLGGGPSLNDVSPDLWAPYHTIGINVAYRLNPDVLFFQDHQFWSSQSNNGQGHGEVIKREYDGLVVTTAPQLRHEPRVKHVERARRRRHGLYGPDGFPEITNSGHGAIVLAHVLGAERIVLLGFDGRASGNWYEGNPRPGDESTYDRRFRPSVNSVLKPLREDGVEIVNATPGSAYDLPIAQPQEVL